MASIKALIDAVLSWYLSPGFTSVEQLSLVMWLLAIGSIAPFKLPDRQWFVYGLIKECGGIEDCVVEGDEDVFAGDNVGGDVA